jgi:hypothetical protein
MDMKEFNAGVIVTQTGTEVLRDVRPFSDRQGEAIDSYLHDLLALAEHEVISPGQRLWVLLHDTTAVIPQTAYTWLANLESRGFGLEIRRV